MNSEMNEKEIWKTFSQIKVFAFSRIGFYAFNISEIYWHKFNSVE